jgi:hypothetical protein
MAEGRLMRSISSKSGGSPSQGKRKARMTSDIRAALERHWSVSAADETLYFADPFEAPPWRAHLVETR